MLINIINFILVILLLTAAYYDAKEKRIPNLITFPVIFMGLILNIIDSGFNGIIISFSGFFIGIAIFFIPFAIGVLGAGDVKLMATVGALMGWRFTILSALFSAIAGIIVVFVYLIYKKKLSDCLKKYFIGITRIILKYTYFNEGNVIGDKLKKFAYSEESANKKNEKLYVPYGIAIALGTLFVLMGNFKGYLLF